MIRIAHITLALAAIAASPACADEPAPLVRTAIDSTRIEDGAGRELGGRVAINIAAGHGNAQANLAAIAVGAASESRASATQAVGVDSAVRRNAHAEIGGDAFTGGHGLASINQAAGNANAQLNLLVVASGGNGGATALQTVDLPALADVTAGDPAAAAAPESSTPLREARIGDAALRSPQGVLQLNQTAGVGNASANAIVLRIPGGAP